MESDEQQIAAVLGRFLAAVSFSAGHRPDYGVLPDLFAEGALLVRTSGERPESWSVAEFVHDRAHAVASGQRSAFEEVETAQVTHQFGNVAQRFSTYAKRGTLDGRAIEADGVIATQLVRTPLGWRIASMVWDDERPGLTVPDL